MSEEEKELLARIGALAGQINRHKNQQAGVQSTHANHHRRNAYRHAAHPYSSQGAHPQRGRPHQHRTLHLNSEASLPSSPNPNLILNSHSTVTPAVEPSSSGWVTRNDRHRQLINVNVYEKESLNRAKAIEETKKRNLNGHRRGERARFREFLARQHSVAATPANPNPTTASNQILIDGIHFRVMDGGKKLAKTLDDHLLPTPKTAVVAGVKFHRTKTGNLVMDRVVQGHRRFGTVKKINEPCKIFSTSGSCPKGPKCRFVHDHNKVALCKTFLKEGKCALGNSCDLSHDLSAERVPNCLHYAKGNCAKAECSFTHSQASPAAPVCKAFGFLGYCEKGADCAERHVFECPDFSNIGRCTIKGCKLPHRERASVLRGQSRPDHDMEDLSDDEVADSDDVDSDEVAEFIDADSDESDVEDRQDFISI